MSDTTPYPQSAGAVSSRTVDKRTARTKAAILQAFEEMICEEHPEQINVKTLTERAGIHRKTFYLHYTCIEALYEDALHRLAQEYAEEVSKLPIPYTYFDLTRIFFEFGSKDPYREALYTSPQYLDFSSKLNQVTLKFNRSRYNPYAQYSPEMQNIINAFVTHASVISFRQWIADGKKVPMEDAVQMVGMLLENGVEAIKK